MDALWANLKLMEEIEEEEEEEEEEEMVDSSLPGDHNALDLCLLGRVLMMKPFNNEAFKSTMKQIWKMAQFFTEKR